jgi:hypothetical protein
VSNHTHYIPVRNSDQAGDIAEVVPAADYAARQAEAAVPQDEGAALDFGPALPAHAAPVSTPATTRRPATNTVIALSGVLLALLLIGLSILTQRSETALGTTAPAPSAATSASGATAAAVTASMVAPSASPLPGIAATLLRASVVRWAPAGDAQDTPLAAGASVRVIAYHSGYPQWRAIAGPGIVQPAWVPAAALSTSATTDLPDLAPPATATALPAAPAPAAPAAPVQAVRPAERCATVSAAGVSATACGPEDDATLQARAQADLVERLHAYAVPIYTMTPYPTFPPR